MATFQVHLMVYPEAVARGPNLFHRVAVALVGLRPAVSSARVRLEELGLASGLAVSVDRSQVAGFVALVTGHQG